MNAHAPITQHDLEQYLDGALTPDRNDAVTEALRCDPVLRSQLTEITRIDALVRETLLGPAAAPARAGRLVPRVAWAAAAGLLLGALLWTLRSPAPSPAIVENTEPVVTTSAEAAPVRLVLSIPLRSRETDEVDPEIVEHPAPPSSPPTPELVAPAGLEAALARGDVAGALALIVDADAPARTGAYVRIGNLIRSARAAESVLDSLPVDRQLEVCRLWSADPQLRPVIFDRLRALASETSIAADHAAVIDALAEDDHLYPWLRSYDLIGATARRAG